MQNYKNHIRFYIPHHFIFYPLLILLIAFTIQRALTDQENAMLWSVITVVFLIIGWLSFMLRQHYALVLQNRIVVLEMRYRYYALTQKRLETVEDRLSFGQIAALRFSSDSELPALLEQTLTNNLSPDQIKKSIKNWLPDHSRV